MSAETLTKRPTVSKQFAPSNDKVYETVRLAERLGQSIVLSSSIPIRASDPLGWLAFHNRAPAMHWRSRSGQEFAGFGVAADLTLSEDETVSSVADRAVEVLTRRWVSADRTLPVPRFFGGFAFDAEASRDNDWHTAGFRSGRLVLPNALLQRAVDSDWLIISVLARPGQDPDDLCEQWLHEARTAMRGLDAPAPVSAGPWNVSDNDMAWWADAVNHVLHRINSGEMRKVVLARRQRCAARESVNRWAVTTRMREAQQCTYEFLLQWNQRAAFVGASPELLFELDGRILTTECVAGTKLRGDSDLSDRRLGDQLTASIKDRREHEHVAYAITESLLRLCERIEDAQPLSIMKLKDLQHLRSTIGGRLKPGVTVGDILTEMHPTPAVGGRPSDDALVTIRELEPVGRGWYAGPVGWIGADRAEFAVAIRSALVDERGAWAYAGAGIVEGSVPHLEWDETTDKLQTFLSAVNQPSKRQ